MFQLARRGHGLQPAFPNHDFVVHGRQRIGGQTAHASSSNSPGDDVVIAAPVQEMGTIFYRQSCQVHIKPVVYGADGDIGCSHQWAQKRRIPHVTAGCFDPQIIQSGTESSRYFAWAPENGSEWRMLLPKANELQERIQLF